MAFFPRNLYHSEGSFTPLFRLLEDFDNYSQRGSGEQRSSLPSWQPKFDVAETRDAYELHGELPGINKEDVHIEFTEPQTLVVRGKAERTYTAGTPPSGFIEGTEVSGAITEGGETATKNEPSSQEVATKSTEKKAEKSAYKTKFWLSERSVGEFSRSFSFPAQVDQDAVAASFKDGILTLVVPKAKKRETKRIAIN